MLSYNIMCKGHVTNNEPLSPYPCRLLDPPVTWWTSPGCWFQGHLAEGPPDLGLPPHLMTPQGSEDEVGPLWECWPAVPGNVSPPIGMDSEKIN